MASPAFEQIIFLSSKYFANCTAVGTSPLNGVLHRALPNVRVLREAYSKSLYVWPEALSSECSKALGDRMEKGDRA